MKTDTIINSIELGEQGADTTFFLIHGYTGTPDDFNGLPQYLHDTYRARVRIILLPGHGTSVRDLDHVSYEDLVAAIEKSFKDEARTAKTIIVGGISFGALMALRLATLYPVHGVINMGSPFSFKFPFSVPGVGSLRFFKKYWRKKFTPSEIKLRQGIFYYKEMHINGLALVKKARLDVSRHASSITCPVLTIHSVQDPIGSMRGVRRFQRKIKVPHELLIFSNKNHNIFYSEKRDDVYLQIGKLVQKMVSASTALNAHHVTAIIPAYNEGARIGNVLDVLTKTPEIDEVIVVDDGSTDNTAAIVKSYPGIKFFLNPRNEGKAYSLQRGIDHTKAEILFFCDADLTNLTPQIVAEIIRPVAAGYYNMFIGVRNNLSQKALTLFALNSGERALRRQLWDEMPASYKKRYRLEVGLNLTSSINGRNFGWKKFEYYQTLKETKYGFWQGTFLRWWMNLDVLSAYFLAAFYQISHLNKNQK